MKKITYITQRKTNLVSNFANSSQVVNTSNAIGKLYNNFEVFFLRYKIQSSHNFLLEVKEKYSVINFKIKSIHNYKFFKNDLSYGLFVSFKFLMNDNIFYTRQDWVAFFLTLINKKVFFEAHDYDRNRLCLKFMSRLCSNRKNLTIITISEQLKKEFIEMKFKNRIHVSHDGVDVEFYKPSNTIKMREKLNIDLNKKIALYSGALREGRGVSKILDIAKIKPEIDFFIFGGRDTKRLSFLKQKSKHLPNISFFGFVKKDILVQYMNAADIFLMPHQKNCDIIKFTSPLKMFEYLAIGKPIIASNFSVFREVLVDKENSLLAEHDSEDDFSKKIDFVLNDKNTYKILSNNALKSSKKYSWENRAKNILKIINEKN